NTIIMGKSFYDLHPADKALSKMNYKDLKIAVIVRGMEFNEVVEGYYGPLATFFKNHYDTPVNPNNLLEFDVWMDKKLEERGYDKDDPLRQFKLSSTLDPDKEELILRRGRIKKAGVRLPKVKKPKAEKNQNFGIRKGTKKEYVMELVKKLHDLGKNLDSKKLLQELISRVIKQYPDANEKSIKIWFSKARKSLDKSKGGANSEK